MVSLSVQQIDAWHRNHLLMTFWYSNVIRGDTVICGLKIVVSWSKSSETPRQWWRSRSMPRISPRGRRRFSGYNHRLRLHLSMYISCPTHHFHGPVYVLESASTRGYPALARPRGPDWSISSTTGCDCHEFWISSYRAHRISSVEFLPNAPHTGSFEDHSYTLWWRQTVLKSLLSAQRKLYHHKNLHGSKINYRKTHYWPCLQFKVSIVVY